MARDWLTTGAVVVTALAAGAGAVYFAERATHAGSTSSGQPSGSTSTSSATTSSPTTGNAGPGPNSHSSGSTSGSQSPSSGSASVPSGRANASGGTVTLQAPSSLAVGSMGQLLAQASGIANPLYQFWWKEPGSNVWQQTGAYSATPSATITATASGSLDTVAFARSASAPSGEAKAIRPQYEAESAVVTISVT